MRLMYAFLIFTTSILVAIAVLPIPGKRNRSNRYATCGSMNSYKIFWMSNDNVETDPDEFTWLALLEYTWDDGANKTTFGCGGSLIDERHVLTAAHCVSESNARLTGVRLGEWNVSSPADCYENREDDCTDDPVNVAVSKIFKHPKYNESGQQENDIAVLRLANPVQFTIFIRPMCLPSDPELQTKTNFTRTNLITAGWGQTPTRQYSDVQMKKMLSFASLDECNQVYQESGRVISEKQLCVGGKTKKDNCHVDLGRFLS